MSEGKKAIGLRLPQDVWEGVKQYGLVNYPGAKSTEGFDVTQTVVTLLKQALDIPDEQPLAARSNALSDERITEMIKQQLDSLLSPALYELVSDDNTGVSKLFNSKITAIVDESISEVSSELEVYTQQQCEAVRDELKKLSAIG